VKDKGVIAGIASRSGISPRGSQLQTEEVFKEEDTVKYGDEVFYVSGSSRSILTAERLVLNSMQRMSAIATKTKEFVNLLEGTKTKILTLKTTPGIRLLEKWAAHRWWRKIIEMDCMT
jgi:nicotinate-nucleotide pyrophosphorylase (carboxylating)